MAITSLNQVRQFYVVENCVTEVDSTGSAPVLDNSTAIQNTGDLKVNVFNNGIDKELYFLYKGVGPEVMRSDLIPLKNLNYVKAVKAADMAAHLKKIEITLASTPVVGQDYLLRIGFRQFYGMSDEDQYIKDAAVHVTSAITDAKDLFDEMKSALDLAFSREVGATKTSNPYLSFTVSGSGSSAKLVIEEKEQEWRLGTQAQERVYFEVYPTTIFDGTDDVIWAAQNQTTGKYYTDVTASNTNVVKNGKKIADLEWFLMGERGDQYRQKGWPNDIPTEYLVDPSKEYSVLELHFAFTDEGVNSYRSEKDLTIVVPNGASGHVYDVINNIIAAINTATGLSIGTLS
jgi:hypothetical protein